VAGNLHPLDSAFVGGSVPDIAAPCEVAASVFGSSFLLSLMIVVSALFFLFFLRMAIDIIPSQIGAVLRSKELVNLENSASLARNRTIIAVVMLIPFLTLIAGYRIYDPGFLSGISGNAYFFSVVAVFTAYVLIREGLAALFPVRPLDGRVRKAAHKSAFTFFITITELGFLSAAFISFLPVATDVAKTAIIIIISVLYIVYFLRKTQVLSMGCNIFQTFLYLCALEILPTGLLVVSALVF